MSFKVFLVESSATPSMTELVTGLDAAFQSVNATWHDAEEVAGWKTRRLRLSDGLECELSWQVNDAGTNDGACFRFAAFSPAAAEAIFQAADRTQSFVYDVQSGEFMRTPSNGGDPPGPVADIHSIPDANVLREHLTPSLEGWSSLLDDSRAN